MTDLTFFTRDAGSYTLTAIVSAELRERIRAMTPVGAVFEAIVFSGGLMVVRFKGAM